MFKFGARSVRLRVVDSEIPGTNGEALGESDWQAGDVVLAGSEVLPPTLRLETAAHEFLHWYEWSHGKPPVDEEERADWFATAFCVIHRTLVTLGGETWLKRLGPGGGLQSPIDALTCGAAVSEERSYQVDCPQCSAPNASTGMVESPIVEHEGRPVCWIGLMCQDCGVLSRWACAAENGGRTNACVVQPIAVTERVEIVKFIAAYPRQARVALVS